MKRFPSAILVALVLGFGGSLAAKEKRAMAPIWRVSDGDSTVFLAGSVHLLREGDLPLPAAFDRVYARSEELVFEIDMARMSLPETASQMRELGSLPEGESLSDRLTEKTVDRLGAYLRRQGIHEDFFETYAPGMIFLLISSFEAKRHGAKPELGLEATFYTKSVKDGKPSRGLETIAFQLSRFDDFEPAKVEELINRALDETANSGETLDEMTAAWKTGNAVELARVIREEETFSPELREVLLIERNRNWIPEIEKALAKEHDVMFLVGAAHLVGEESVVDLLRRKGLEVTQLTAGDR